MPRARADAETGVWTCDTSSIPTQATGPTCWLFHAQSVCLTGDGKRANLRVKYGG